MEMWMYWAGLGLIVGIIVVGFRAARHRFPKTKPLRPQDFTFYPEDPNTLMTEQERIQNIKKIVSEMHMGSTVSKSIEILYGTHPLLKEVKLEHEAKELKNEIEVLKDKIIYLETQISEAKRLCRIDNNVESEDGPCRCEPGTCNYFNT